MYCVIGRLETAVEQQLRAEIARSLFADESGTEWQASTHNGGNARIYGKGTTSSLNSHIWIVWIRAGSKILWGAKQADERARA